MWRDTDLWGLRRLVSRHLVTTILVSILAYFAFHAVHGERGLLAWIDYSRLIEIKRAELTALRREREELENRVAGLQPGAASRDSLEEQLKRLGFVEPDEIIILHPDRDVAPSSATTPSSDRER